MRVCVYEGGLGSYFMIKLQRVRVDQSQHESPQGTDGKSQNIFLRVCIPTFSKEAADKMQV